MRVIKKVFQPNIVPEGKGAQVARIIGTNQLRDLNPFIMLDFFSSKLPGGFPDHPHRGFETVSYLLKGSFYHEDSNGNKGRLNEGDVQWMTAGKGVMHSEMPGSFDELSVGFQLWINLEAKNKLCDPQYQEFRKNELPEAMSQDKGISVKVIAGEALGVKGPVYTRTPAYYLDVKMKENANFQQQIPRGWNSLAFVYYGEGEFAKNNVKVNQVVLLDINDKNEILEVQTKTKECHFILIAGLPINEPIVQHGPFVMNSQEQIQQTFEDYQYQRNGFENSQRWESKIKNMSKGYKPQY